MKIIDLLNKIANGKGIPKIIKVFDTIYEYDNIGKYKYRSCEDGDWLFEDYALVDILNKKIEIIEEDKPIEKILVNYQDGHSQEEINEYLKKEKENE